MTTSLPLRWRKALVASVVSSTVKLVGFVISVHMDSEGLAWPSRELIAREASLSVRSVEKAVPLLEEAGLLAVERDARGGRSHVNRYLALLPQTANLVHQAEARRANDASQTAHVGRQTANPARPKLKDKKKSAGASSEPPPVTIDNCVQCDAVHPIALLDAGKGFCPRCARVLPR
jgi:hypothetical protein